jgi:ribosome small subunit-dependent GTPase A
MSREDKKLQKFFEELASRELRKANQAQAKLRRAVLSKPPRPRLDPALAPDEDFAIEEPQPRRAAGKPRTEAPSGPLTFGLVVETGAGYCDVLASGARLRCRAHLDAAVGDHVSFSERKRRIETVHPRRAVLSRPDPHNPQQQRVLAANIDVVVVVVSLKDPPLRTGLIDRYLIAIEHSGAAPLICVNKIDLLESDADLAPLRAYGDIGVPVILCSAQTGLGVDLLADALAGRVGVLSGHSGVGKSSLLNALDPTLGLTVSAVSEAHGKGRHTTTSSTVHQLPNGAVLIDTPGIREFGLWDVSRREVRNHFREFDAFAADCAFSGCSHTHEPDCGVKLALARGDLPPERYAGYRRILETL